MNDDQTMKRGWVGRFAALALTFGVVGAALAFALS